MSPSQPRLDHQHFTTQYIAMVVRNAMEAFHRVHLSDAQMRELNPTIRNAIFTALHALGWEDRSESARRHIEYHLRSIPSYWEPPALLAGYRADLEPDIDGAAPGPLDSRSPEYRTALASVQPILDRIAKSPAGAPLQGRRGTKLRHALERYTVDRFLKIPEDEREGTDRLGYLEFDLTERVKASWGRDVGEQSDAAK